MSVLSDPLLIVGGISSSEMTQDERDEDGAEPGHGTVSKMLFLKKGLGT